MSGEPLLSVRALRKHFAVKGGVFSREIERVHAVDGVSFDIEPGETLGLVGESGCGKSTTGRCILRLIEPSSGEIWFKGADVTKMGGDDLRALRRDMQIIFQDPYASLNPRLKVGSIIGEALIIHKLAPTQKAMEERVVQLLETVGLQADHMHRFPHEFSGGQRQRIGIARALAVEPKLIVCDEPVSALDVSIQAQVINLLEDLQGLADDRPHGQARIERSVRVLEDDLHVAPQRAQRIAVHARDVGALEHHLAGGRLDQAQDAAAGRRFAAARLAHQPQGLALADVEAHAVDGMHAVDLPREDAARHREVLLEFADGEQGLVGHGTPLTGHTPPGGRAPLP